MSVRDAAMAAAGRESSGGATFYSTTRDTYNSLRVSEIAVLDFNGIDLAFEDLDGDGDLEVIYI